MKGNVSICDFYAGAAHSNAPPWKRFVHRINLSLFCRKICSIKYKSKDLSALSFPSAESCSITYTSGSIQLNFIHFSASVIYFFHILHTAHIITLSPQKMCVMWSIARNILASAQNEQNNKMLIYTRYNLDSKTEVTIHSTNPSRFFLFASILEHGPAGFKF